MKLNILLGILILAIFLVSCTTGEVVEQSTFKIGAPLALTGKVASYGENVKSGIDLAVEEINAKGGINGKPLEIIYEDTQCDSKKGVATAQKLIEIDNVSVIIGAVCSSTTLAITPLAEESKTILVIPLSSAPAIKNAGDYIFRNRVSGEVHSVKMAEFAYFELNAETASILHINMDNGVGYSNAFEENFESLGGEILGIETYEKGETNFATSLTKIKKQNPDVLYIAGSEHWHAVRQMEELGLEIQIIAPITFEAEELLEIAGDAAEGAFYSYSAFDPESDQSYFENYKRKYGKQSEAFAANAYDATLFIAEGFRLCGEDTTCIKEYLYSIENYDGPSGLTTFDEYGEVEKPLIIKTVENGEFVFHSD